MPPTGPTAAPAPGDTTPPSYAIRGTLAGLAANTRLVLLDNGGDALTLTANGAFGFATPVAFNTAYAVTVGTQPPWQNCSVSNGSGTATADVGDVQVNCADAQAQVSTFAGSDAAGSTNGSGATATFNAPQALAVDAAGNVYVADTYNHQIRTITPDGVVSTLAGTGAPGSADGAGTAAQFSFPAGLAVDLGGNVYLSDTVNHTIRKIAPDGVVTTLAGSTTPGSADGTGTAAQFNYPAGMAVDASGHIYVADSGNHMIRKISPDGVVTTVAGSTTFGSADGNGAAAQFNNPLGLDVSTSGDLYVTDYGNSVIRRITPAGDVTTLAGSGVQGFADGTAATAEFNGMAGISVDANGYVYVAEFGNQVIRKVTPAGDVTTLAGSGTPGSADGIGTAAQFNYPFDVQVDAGGNLYVASGNAIRKIAPVR